MRLIKRYPNRKLYDTEAKQYITLEGIAGLIRQGTEVQVVDHASEEDVTALVLTQVIAGQEKRRAGFLPQTVLAGLIRAGGDTLGTLRRSLALPLDLLRLIDEEIERRVQALVSQGELAGEEGGRWREMLLTPSHRTLDASGPGEPDLERLLLEHGIPTRDDLQRLSAQLAALEAKLDRLRRRA